MRKSLFIAITLLTLIIIILTLVFFTIRASDRPNRNTELATCLVKSGAKFYGAFWCPNCLSQKKMFGNASSHLPYVECSTADRKGQIQLCVDKNIGTYPTWEFGDGTRISGELSLQELSNLSGCPLPQ